MSAYLKGSLIKREARAGNTLDHLAIGVSLCCGEGQRAVSGNTLDHPAIGVSPYSGEGQ